MARYKIIYLLLLTYTVYVSAKEVEDRTINLKPPDKLVLQKSSPYSQDTSFFSRVKNWFFPASDTVPAETHHGGPQYLPPQPYQSEPDCNPCNKAPWIPVASSVGHNTLINFVPPSSHLGGLKPPVPEYGAPPFQQEYGAPPPSPQYGAPPPSSQYGGPPPPSPQYGAPPPSSQYGGPPPPSSQYGSPPPSSQYGAPPPSSQYGGPPPPSSQYGAPPQSSQYGAPPPSSQYGGPPPSSQYGTPSHYDSSITADFRPPPPPPNFRPRPEKLHPMRNMRPTTHLRPVNQNYVPIGMQPPPLEGHYHSLPTPPSTNYNQPPPPPVPSDSYGAPITGPNADYLRPPEYLPPLEQLPLSSAPIPLPNLSPGPLAPIYNSQDFNHGFDNIPQQQEHYEVKSTPNVQVLPSVKVADFLASVEHPINVIQSPLVEVNVKNEDPGPKLSDNPIIVDDTHTAASVVNVTIQQETPKAPKGLNPNFIKDILHYDTSNFTAPPMDYGNWRPSWSPTTWLQTVPSTTTKPKQIQIIVPYISNIKMAPSQPYTTLVPMYTPPSTTEEIWSKFVDDFNSAESKKIAATAFTPATTQVYNIRDVLKDTKEIYSSDSSDNLPFDVISLQNNIDDWTQQSFGKSEKSVHTAKKIPENFFPTTIIETTTVPFDHEQAGSNKKETKVEDDIETNFIPKETTTVAPSWDNVKPTVLPLTREKLYIVTPQPYDPNTPTPKTAWSHPPKINLNNTIYPTPKFVIRVDPEDENKREKLKENVGPVTVVFSEWPHLINNLQTTTPKTPTSNHPLFGLMDLSKYTPPPNSTVETIDGHSRVVTVVTPATVTRRTRNVN